MKRRPQHGELESLVAQLRMMRLGWYATTVGGPHSFMVGIKQDGDTLCRAFADDLLEATARAMEQLGETDRG